MFTCAMVAFLILHSVPSSDFVVSINWFIVIDHTLAKYSLIHSGRFEEVTWRHTDETERTNTGI